MKNLKITLFVSVLIFMFSCEKETATKTTPTINNCFIGLPDTINHVGSWKVTSNLGYNIYAYPSFNLLVDSSKYFHETGNLNFTISNGNCEKSININTNCDGISVSCVFFEPINDTEFYKMTYIDLIVLQDELVKFNSSINPTSFYGIKKDTTILGNTAAVTIKETSGIKL